MGKITGPSEWYTLTLNVYTDYIKAYWARSQVPMVHLNGSLLALNVHTDYI